MCETIFSFSSSFLLDMILAMIFFFGAPYLKKGQISLIGCGKFEAGMLIPVDLTHKLV